MESTRRNPFAAAIHKEDAQVKHLAEGYLFSGCHDVVKRKNALNSGSLILPIETCTTCKAQ